MSDYIRRAFYHYTGSDLRVMPEAFQRRFARLPPDAAMDDIEFVTGPLDPARRVGVIERLHDFSMDALTYNIYLDNCLNLLAAECRGRA